MKEDQEAKIGREIKYQVWGWMLFVICAVLFIASSLNNHDALTLAASVVFFIACIVFLIPLVRANREATLWEAKMDASSKRYHIALLTIVSAVWVWSGVQPHDTRLTWVLETLPFMIALPVMLLTYKRFPLTNLTYALIAIHSVILMLGGHYSYAKVPLGFWMEDWFGWTRNNYDKIGHFMQGFGPAIYTREILARTSPLGLGKWLAVISVAVPLAFSAVYEIIEWLASLSNPTDTEAFLGTQGYIWDTQSDMFWCLVGSVVALVFLTKWHNRYLLRTGVLESS